MTFKSIEYRAHNGYDTEAASDEAAIPADAQGESLTVQSHAEDADINVMLKRFGVLGRMPESVRVPEYGDFTQVGDFRSALHAVMDAQDEFMKLPPRLRAELNNDPQEFLKFVQDPANLDRMREMGLAVKQEKSDGKAGVDVGAPGGAAGGGAAGNAGAVGGSA